MADIPARENVPARPITVTVKTAGELSGLGYTTIWKLIADRRLEPVRVGGRTLITFSSLEALLTPRESPQQTTHRRPGRPPKLRAAQESAP